MEIINWTTLPEKLNLDSNLKPPANTIIGEVVLDVFKNINEKKELIIDFNKSFLIDELENIEFLRFLNKIDSEFLVFVLEHLGKFIEKKQDFFDLELVFSKKINLSIPYLKEILSLEKIDFKLVKNINFLNALCYTSDEFWDILENNYTKEENINLFSDKINLSDIEKLINNVDNIYIPDGIYQNLFSRLNKEKENFSEKVVDLMNLKHYLFNSRSNGSKIFDELVKKMDEEPNKNLYSIMSEKIDDVFGNIVPQNSKKYNEKEIKENQKRIIKYQKNSFSEQDIKIGKELGIDENELVFSIYLRYGNNGLNYPEIAEYIVLFLEKYFREGNSKYFKNIRIIPRNLDGFPNDKLFEGKNIYKINVKGKDKFEVALHKNGIPLFLSHSTNSDKFKTPQIISGTMRYIRDGDIFSRIELEKVSLSYIRGFILLDSSLTEILQETIKNIQDLEEELDKIN